MPCTINGQAYAFEVPPMRRLLDVIRQDCGLTGTKEGCGEGECGACAVILDGELTLSCLVPAAQIEGANIETVEGYGKDEIMKLVQQAFLEQGGAQCGICTPGMIMASVALLRQNATPTLDEVRQGLAGNICRCTGYVKIFDSVLLAASRIVS